MPEDTAQEGTPKKRSAKKRSSKKRVAKRAPTDEAPRQNAKRRDPRPRRVCQTGIGPMVVNKDPKKHYVFCNPSDQESGQGHFYHLGYEVEVAGDPSNKRSLRVSNALPKRKGEPLEWKGSILMSCPIEEYEDRVEHGDGISNGMTSHRERIEQVYAPGRRNAAQADFNTALAELPRTRQQYFGFRHGISGN
jgi:hypothetical protein